MSQIHVRWMIHRDMDAALACGALGTCHNITPAMLVEMLRPRNRMGQVAEQGDKILGFMVYEYDESTNRLRLLELHAKTLEAEIELLLKLREKAARKGAVLQDYRMRTMVVLDETVEVAEEDIRKAYEEYEKGSRCHIFTAPVSTEPFYTMGEGKAVLVKDNHDGTLTPMKRLPDGTWRPAMDGQEADAMVTSLPEVPEVEVDRMVNEGGPDLPPLNAGPVETVMYNETFRTGTPKRICHNTIMVTPAFPKKPTIHEDGGPHVVEDKK